MFSFENVLEGVRQLTGARERLLASEAWCKWAAAVDAQGKPISALDAAAVSWSAYGALRRESFESGRRAGNPIQIAVSVSALVGTKGFLLMAVPENFKRGSRDNIMIVDYNDALIEHSEVIQWFERAIGIAMHSAERFDEWQEERG